MTLTNSTVNGNLALGGGGIGIFPGEVTTVINSTISGNTATDSYGGGIRNSTDGVLTLINSTVSNNLAGYGGGISNWNGTVILQNTILAGNMARTCPDCYGIMSSSGYNLVENASGCIFTPTADDITYIHPLLGPLQDNGGPTETHALLVGSPAFDAIPEGNCSDHRGTPITTDQRGIPRPQGAACDIGAYEAQTADLNLSKTVDQASPDVEETIVFTIQATNDGPLEATGVVISDTLPLGLTLTFSNTSQGAYTSGTGEWNVGSLPVGLSATLTITATVGTGTAGTTITNTATITAADQFDPGNNNIATAAVTVPGLAPAGQCIYLPLTMRKHIPPVTFPLHIGDSIPVHTVAYQGEIFYTKLVQIPDELSSSGRFYFSSQRDAVTEVLVDDKLVVLSGGAEVFAYNFSTSGHPEPTTIEVPRTTMEELAGQTVTIEYRDIYGVVVEASTMWLIWTP